MKNELYQVYECDYSDRNKEFVTTDIDKAVERAMELNCKDYRVYVDIYELDGGKIYSESFNKEDDAIMTSEKLKESLMNKSNKYWNV